MDIKSVDICVGLAWGDEGKGKIVSQLSKTGNYDFVCRWSGGNNAGHTVYVDDKSYSTHLIPSGIFYGIKSIIGPGCVVNINAFIQEINYLNENKFDTTLIKISPNAHVVYEEHIEEDSNKFSKKLGTTKNGIGPCYRDKYQRTGTRLIDYLNKLDKACSLHAEWLRGLLWDGKLYGNILCEGAQGFWLDIDYGNYPYVTSSNTLPYGACNLGFSPKKIDKIYGAAKIYDTRVGYDPEFPESLLENEELDKLCTVGKEFGTTTGRKRIVNYLNLDKLIETIIISGTTNLIISKVDVAEEVGVYKFLYNNSVVELKNIQEMKEEITKILLEKTDSLESVYFSGNAKEI